MAEPSAKSKVLEALQQLPPDATVEQAMERLYFLAKIERGLEQAEAGKTIPHDEVERRFLSGAVFTCAPAPKLTAPRGKHAK